MLKKVEEGGDKNAMGSPIQLRTIPPNSVPKSSDWVLKKVEELQESGDLL